MMVEMSLNIKNPEAHTLAGRLAKITGETLTEAVTTALRERLERLEQTEEANERRYQALMALVKDSRRLWRAPLLSVDHGEMLYDERGLPK
jgi:antitoxin VapB